MPTLRKDASDKPENFTAATGVAVEVNVFGSNEEMLAKLQAGGAGWSLFVPTNYTISTYVAEGLIQRLAAADTARPDQGEQPYFLLGQQRPRAWGRGGPAGPWPRAPRRGCR